MWLGFPHRVGPYRPEGSPVSTPGCWSLLQRYGGIYDPGIRPYPPRVRRDLGVGPRGNSRRALAPRAPANEQSPSGVGVSTPCGAVSPPGDLRFHPRCWSCSGIDGCPTRGWELIISGCGGTSAMAQGATLAARWLHEPQPISNYPVGLGFPHPARRYRPGGSSFTSPGSWSCRDMDGFLTRGWELILLGVRWLSTIPSQSAIGQWD